MLVEAPRSANYIERFKVIFAQQAELKAKRAELKQQQAEDTELTSHMELAADTLAEWTNSYIGYKLSHGRSYSSVAQ